MNKFEHIKDVMSSMSDSERSLRKMLALSFESTSKGYLYGDDWELQLTCPMPEGCTPIFIDFMRDSVIEIENKISERNLGWLAYLQKNEE